MDKNQNWAVNAIIQCLKAHKTSPENVDDFVTAYFESELKNRDSKTWMKDVAVGMHDNKAALNALCNGFYQMNVKANVTDKPLIKVLLYLCVFSLGAIGFNTISEVLSDILPTISSMVLASVWDLDGDKEIDNFFNDEFDDEEAKDDSNTNTGFRFPLTLRKALGTVYSLDYVDGELARPVGEALQDAQKLYAKINGLTSPTKPLEAVGNNTDEGGHNELKRVTIPEPFEITQHPKELMKTEELKELESNQIEHTEVFGVASTVGSDNHGIGEEKEGNELSISTNVSASPSPPRPKSSEKNNNKRGPSAASNPPTKPLTKEEIKAAGGLKQTRPRAVKQYDQDAKARLLAAQQSAMEELIKYSPKQQPSPVMRYSRPIPRSTYATPSGLPVVKQTTSTLLRAESLVDQERRKKEEMVRLSEKGYRNAVRFNEWQDRQKRIQEEEEARHVIETRLKAKEAHEQSRKAQEVAKLQRQLDAAKTKIDSSKILGTAVTQKETALNENRRRAELIGKETRDGVKEKVGEMAKDKQGVAERTKQENKQLLERAGQKREEDLKKKAELVQKIRTEIKENKKIRAERMNQSVNASLNHSQESIGGASLEELSYEQLTKEYNQQLEMKRENIRRMLEEKNKEKEARAARVAEELKAREEARKAKEEAGRRDKTTLFIEEKKRREIEDSFRKQLEGGEKERKGHRADLEHLKKELEEKQREANEALRRERERLLAIKATDTKPAAKLESTAGKYMTEADSKRRDAANRQAYMERRMRQKQEEAQQQDKTFEEHRGGVRAEAEQEAEQRRIIGEAERAAQREAKAERYESDRFAGDARGWNTSGEYDL